MRHRIRNVISTLGVCIFASVIYGIAHDLLSTQVCLEYFTVHHPRIVESENPFVLAFVWGVAATWWMGFMLGCGLALVSNNGAMRPLPVGALVRPLTIALAGLLAAAVLTWIVIYLFGTFGPMLADRSRTTPVPELDRRLMASGLAHLVSYGGAVFAAFGLAIWIHGARRRLG